MRKLRLGDMKRLVQGHSLVAAGSGLYPGLEAKYPSPFTLLYKGWPGRWASALRKSRCQQGNTANSGKPYWDLGINDWMGGSHRSAHLKQDLKLLYFSLSKANVRISEHLWLLSKATQWFGHSPLSRAPSNSWESEPQQPLFMLEKLEQAPWAPVMDWMCPPKSA